MRILIGLSLLFFIGCTNASFEELTDSPVQLRIPSRFDRIQFPEDNQPTELRILLGRILFYDNRLSLTNDINCGSCHVLSAAFTDGRKTSEGVFHRQGSRNAPTLANMAWSPYFMMEGGVPTLEAQTLGPLLDTMEMGGDLLLAVERLNQDDYLKRLAKAAYGRDSIDPYVVTRALANFERTFISGDSFFDRYQLGKKEEMNESQVRGMKLFFSEKTLCAECHKGQQFTDYQFHNIGLYEEYADMGKELTNGKDSDIGRFKTPTLRNIALTAPYMHDGSLNSLEEVIELYDAGGKQHRNKDERIKPLNLSAQEKADLKAFLEALTDYNFVQNSNLLPVNK